MTPSGGWRWSLNPMVTSGLIAALVLLVIVAVVSVHATSVFIETTHRVSDTRKMLEELRQWYAQIEITDSDEMRYLNRPDMQFKQAVERDKASTQKEMKDVIEAVQNNPARRAAIERIQNLAAAKAEFMSQRIQEREHNQDPSEGWIPKSDELLWQVRRQITELIKSESAELDLRSQQAQRLGRQALFAMPVSIGLSLCILGAMIFLLNREVGHRIRAEKAIREANKELDQHIRNRTAALQTALTELEGFSYSVAHDLRAPIRAIGGYAGILSDTCGKTLPDEGKELLEVVGKEAARMGRLIDDLLRFSRLNRQPMATSPVEMAQCARGTFDALAVSEPGRSFDFRLSPLPEVYGDAAMLRQVWVNLISNAIKFTSGQPISVIEISSIASASEIIYCVTDNGTGFDMRYADHLFKPFQRLHREDEFSGTGIGLALVERIIRRHGGRVWAEGEPGHGAAFYFALPQHQS